MALRSRVAISFGLVIFVITGALAVATWTLTSGYVTAQRQNTVVAQVSADAALVRQTLRFRPNGLGDLLAGFGGGPDASVLVRLDGRWTVSGRQVPVAAVPPDLVSAAASGDTVARRIDLGRLPTMVAGVSLRPGSDVLVEFAPVEELARTQRFLAVLLCSGTVLATALGMGLGAWTARRSLRPLDALTTAAGLVARGDLDARLPEQGEPDLATLATTFNHTVVDLQERVRRDARFAGDVSHELRSPLTTLVGAAGVLRRRRDELGPAGREAVDLLDTDLDRFARTVDDLLEISKMDEPVDHRDLDRVHLADLVEAAVTRHDPTVTVDITPGAPPVLADRRRLDAVVGNLLVNADRHGGGAVRVGVGPADSSATARLEVDDAGPGVDPSNRTEIFERFARATAAGRRGDGTGSGLGLALVAGHVRRHSGTVTVADRPGGGARFVVELPAAPPD
jgi:signal transduction histidine kinase